MSEVRAKFRVTSHKIHEGHNETNCAVSIEMSAVGADEVPENQRFHKYTPSGTLTMWVTNQSVVDSMLIGSIHYLDFTQVAK